MKRVQLVFPNANDAWNFLTKTKTQHVDVADNTISGFFADSEVAMAQTEFSADVKDDIPAVVQENAATDVTGNDTAVSSTGAEIELTGKSGTTYPGTIYTQTDNTTNLPLHAIICLSNSRFINNTWQHAVNSIYKTDNVQGEIARFKERADLTHIIVIPEITDNKADVVDDLRRNYLHQ